MNEEALLTVRGGPYHGDDLPWVTVQQIARFRPPYFCTRRGGALWGHYERTWENPPTYTYRGKCADVDGHPEPTEQLGASDAVQAERGGADAGPGGH